MNRRTMVTAVMLACVVVLIAPTAWAQGGRGRGQGAGPPLPQSVTPPRVVPVANPADPFAAIKAATETPAQYQARYRYQATSDPRSTCATPTRTSTSASKLRSGNGKPLNPPQTWAIEMSTTVNMQQRGITPAILKVGKSISVKVNPLFSGGFSGNYTSVVMIDGVKNAANGAEWKPAN